MKRWWLPVLLAAGFLGGLIAFAPLSAALALSGAGNQGLGWTRAEGTILSGRLSGITLGSAAYGDANLKLRPAAFLSAQLQYAVGWTGPQGDGRGVVSAGPGGRLSLRHADLDLDLSQLDEAALWIRQSGGRVQITGASVRFGPAGCLSAEGIARSDVLERNVEILGAGWAPMQGALRCDRGALVIPMNSENRTGTRFFTELRLAPGQAGRFEARVTGIVPRELAFGLPIAGFVQQGQDYIYQFSTSDVSAPRP